MTWENFHAKVNRLGEEECWPWTASRRGGRCGKAYGAFGLSPKEPIYAHRMAYALAQNIDPRSLPRGLVIRHKCDNSICCNPRHLEPGTQKDNARDMVERGRSTRGERNPRRVLSEHQARDIKAMLKENQKHRVIAAKHGVCRATVSEIARGATWAWLEGVGGPTL